MDFEKICETIAKKHGVSVQAVKEEMGTALKMAWGNQDNDSDVKEKQREVSPNGEVPTAEDFVRFMMDKIMTDQD